ILLYGVPGTGKSLIASKLKDMVNTSKTKIVNGPEILSKFVGQSEENIRHLFADAEKEKEEKGSKSGLHLIIFDEIDAICRQRGSSSGSGYVYDGIVNQLLCKFDGVEKLDNILIIGTTNRIDLIDEALLRAGRFDIKIEVPLPNYEGRKQIFEIHTKKYKESGKLGEDVDLDYLVSKARNYSGAEIKDVVKFAAAYANEKIVTIDDTVQFDIQANEKFVIQKIEFDRAMEDVIPSFGSNERRIKNMINRSVRTLM
ncbi:vesicle-fusing ATPase 2-like protein, partial [Leptotrombidium deliense]